MSVVQPTKASLRRCIINGVPHIIRRGNNVVENFTVHSLRVYEDICKSYFTAQLVIEDQLNNTDPYLFSSADVEITFMTDPDNKYYTERFKLYSFESTPKQNNLTAGMLITCNLIGHEYFNDTQNTVMQNFKNVPATTAAGEIHRRFLGENGNLNITSNSKGMIGKDDHPHQVTNMKPIKAIHDLLDKAISTTVQTSAFTYFRNKPGYVIGPLEELLNTAAIAGRFIHRPGAASSLADTLYGYNNIIHLRPMTPPSQETAAGSRSNELDSLMKTNSFFDIKTGNFITNVSSTGLTRTLNTIQNFKNLKTLENAGRALLGKAVKSPFGARLNFSIINDDRQDRQIDKAGPGGHKSAEEAFVAMLGFSKKYWVSVPIQSGIEVTVGNRINIIYPVGTRSQAKTLFVARLIHEINFKTPGAKAYEPAQGITEMYGVEW